MRFAHFLRSFSGNAPLLSDDLLNIADLGTMSRDVVEQAIRSRVRCVYLGDNIALCRILGRYKFFVDTTDVGFASHIMLDGFWEIWLTQFIARQVKPGMTVIDIGANFGYYSVLLSDLVFDKGNCLCIEANPVVAEKLEASLSINGFGGRSTVATCAAGDGSESSVRFYIPHHEPKNARVVGDTAALDPSGGRTINVPSKSVDAICDKLSRVDFIKIDAEGAEPSIFRGMTGLLSRYKPDIILEFNYLRYANPEIFIADIQAYYPNLRYLDFNGSIGDVSVEALSQRNLGEDWLLFLSSR